MAGVQAPTGDLEAMCESDFERAVLRRLVEAGYRVSPQVGAEGYRIDLVVEGASSRRLAVECDGDKYHGPERWADDMRRQRILERVGWRFWRCWASSFALDPDGCMADLFATLNRMGVEPDSSERAAAQFTLHVTAAARGPDQEEEDPRTTRSRILSRSQPVGCHRDRGSRGHPVSGRPEAARCDPHQRPRRSREWFSVGCVASGRRASGTLRGRRDRIQRRRANKARPHPQGRTA